MVIELDIVNGIVRMVPYGIRVIILMVTQLVIGYTIMMMANYIIKNIIAPEAIRKAEVNSTMLACNEKRFILL